MINPAARRNLALAMLAERLEKNPPSGMVIAAGSTGSIPATAKLLGVIAGLPQGAVVLPGLDRELDEKSWRELDPGHPQFGLKQLLESIGAARDDVARLAWRLPQSGARDAAARKPAALRPPPMPGAPWPMRAAAKSPKVLKRHLITAADPAQEALVIALALRETLEQEGRTAALVTPDRNLARRVAGELGRWQIAIDDSAGRPLAHTSAGAFLCLLAEAAEAAFAPVPLAGAAQTSLRLHGRRPGGISRRARALDRWPCAGRRPDPGLGGIAKAIAHASAEARSNDIAQTCSALGVWWTKLAAILSPLELAFAKTDLPLDDLLTTHLAAAERLSCAEGQDCPIWRDTDGEAAALFFEQFRDSAAGLPAFEPRAYPVAAARPGDEGAGAAAIRPAIAPSPFWVRWKRGCKVSISPSWAV